MNPFREAQRATKPARPARPRLTALSERKWKKNVVLYTFLLPALLYYVIFEYVPLYGLQIAFKDFNLFAGITESPWVGFKHFESFFNSVYFYRLMRNTFLISFYSLLFAFPIPIILALMLNELKSDRFRSIFQGISYVPNFISTVIVCGLIVNFLAPTTGIVNVVLQTFGFSEIQFMSRPEWFRTIYVGSGIWQTMGWGSIIYYASLRAIDPSQYEAADIDGANRWQKMRYVSIPGIMPTIVILLLLNLGNLLKVGFEKVFLLYNPSTYETADVLSTYVYRAGLVDQQYSFAAAVGLFNSVITLVLLVLFNYLARRFSDNSLW